MIWAEKERGELEAAVEKCMNDAASTAAGSEGRDDGMDRSGNGNDDGLDNSKSANRVSDKLMLQISLLIERVADFSRDLGLVLEFLELNATAFSKIMKKYDKRTRSTLREGKLKQLRKEHLYLYEGGELREAKKRCGEWIMVLREVRDGPSPVPVLNRRRSWGSSQRRLSLTMTNSFVMAASQLEDAKGSIADGEDAIATDEDNPQESEDVHDSLGEDVRISADGSMRASIHKSQRSARSKDAHGAKEEVTATAGARTEVKTPAHRSVHKTEDALILERMIDRVNKELCLQKADSPFFDSSLDQLPPPSFTSSEVDLAGELGQGEFCTIYEVKAFNVPESCHICFLHREHKDAENIPTFTKKKVGTPHSKESSELISSFHFDPDLSDYDELESDHEDEGYHDKFTRGFMKDHCLRDGEARYAIKRIKSSLIGEEEITEAGVDLAREAEFLAALKHPNIICIRGTINNPGHPKYALILDRLFDTLEVQMQKWKAESKPHKGKFKSLMGKHKKALDSLLLERVIALYDLSRAMAYLHSRGILHRDIKPANIGFDVRGDLKIFDFGLAKELKPCDKEGEDQYHTDGMAGTRRYMAPEVAQVLPYGLSADVYSFGILMWEVLALKAPFEKFSREKHYKEVMIEGKRPKVPKAWPFDLQNLVEKCWHQDPSERPTFRTVCEQIRFGMPELSNHEVNLSGRSTEMLSRSERTIRGNSNDIENERLKLMPDISIPVGKRIAVD